MIPNCKTHHICAFLHFQGPLSLDYHFLEMNFPKFVLAIKVCMLSYGSKSYWPIILHDCSECYFSLTTWLFGMIIIDIPSVLAVLLVVLEIEKEILLLIIVYCIPGLLGTFIYDFILLIRELPTKHRILIVGDFNLDQMLPENVAKVDPLLQNCNLTQISQDSTHIHGGLLDTSNSSAVSFLSSPCSDHFFFFFPNLIIIFI